MSPRVLGLASAGVGPRPRMQLTWISLDLRVEHVAGGVIDSSDLEVDLESFAYLGWRCIMYRCSEDSSIYVTGIGGLLEICEI